MDNDGAELSIVVSVYTFGSGIVTICMLVDLSLQAYMGQSC